MGGSKGLKPFSRLDTDEDTERFVAEADLSDYEFFRLSPGPL